MVQEMRVILRNVGNIDPSNIDEYISTGGYQALEKARTTEPADLISEVERSGRLRGRGGAAFNTGLKWRSAAEVSADKKYVVCNADEGEPGTYKDRIIMEGDPHSVIEGILICAHAIGADEAYIYCRGEYQKSQALLRNAIAQAEERGLTGQVTIRVVSGAGSYVCGEETALLESLEGKRGEPRLKPPFPTVSGYRGKPTVVNNVETFATIPSIVTNGAEWFRSIGAEKYPGTKIYVLSGDVVNRTWAELPTNTSLHDIVYGIGGGIANGKKLKAIQVGGSSCAFMPADMIESAADFDSLAARGAALGSGSVLVIAEDHNIVDLLVPIADFFAHESCGKCSPCREGTLRMAQLIHDIAEGRGTEEKLELVEKLCRFMPSSCFCPLGQSATAAVASALKYFREDFEAKLKGKESEPNV